MKKTAIILDFNPKIDLGPYSNLDIYIIDRYNDKISDIITTNDNIDKLEEELSFMEFYQIISKKYQQIFCLFLSFDYLDITDYLLTKNINKNRHHDDAKVYTYLLNYKNEHKKEIVGNTILMLEKNYEIKDVIVRIHQIRKKEAFSLNDILMKYITCL